MKKFEYGQPSTSLSQEFDLASSTVQTTVRDHEHIKDHVECSAPLKAI
jgi:hypothetical protein